MPESRTLRGLVAGLLLVAATASCGDGVGGSGGAAGSAATGPTGPVSVAQASAFADGTAVQVRGFVVVEADDAVIADLLAESYPPQPGGATLRLVGVRLSELDGVRRTGRITWTEAPVVVTGVVAAGALSLD